MKGAGVLVLVAVVALCVQNVLAGGSEQYTYDFSAGLGSFHVNDTHAGCSVSLASSPNPLDGAYVSVTSTLGADCAVLDDPFTGANVWTSGLAVYMRPRTASYSCSVYLLGDPSSSPLPTLTFPRVSLRDDGVMFTTVDDGVRNDTLFSYPSPVDRARTNSWSLVQVYCQGQCGTLPDPDCRCWIHVDGMQIAAVHVPERFDGIGDDPTWWGVAADDSGAASVTCDFDSIQMDHGGSTNILDCWDASAGQLFSRRTDLDHYDGDDYVLHFRRPVDTGGYPLDPNEFQIDSGAGLQAVTEQLVSDSLVFVVRIADAKAGNQHTITLRADTMSLQGNSCSPASHDLAVEIPSKPVGPGESDPSFPVIEVTAAVVGVVIIAVAVGVFKFSLCASSGTGAAAATEPKA